MSLSLPSKLQKATLVKQKNEASNCTVVIMHYHKS